MTSFTIDDVRETMPSEVSRFLHEIEASGDDLLAQSLLSERWPSKRALLRTIATRGHAISGTSLLVSATALAACARLIEALAARADVELREAHERAARARRALQLVPAGVEHMREILRLELEHREDEAHWASAEWQGGVEALLEELEQDNGLVAQPSAGLTISIPPEADDEADDASGAATQAPSPPAVLSPTRPKARSGESGKQARESTAFEPLELDFSEENNDEVELVSESSFDDIWDDPADAPATEAPAAELAPAAAAVSADAEARLPEPNEAEEEGSFSFEPEQNQTAASAAHVEVLDELRSVFQQEARESIVALQGHLATLAADLGDRQLALPLERMYHTLKGAAATVGLAEVSAKAANLQQRCEAVALYGIDANGLNALVRETNEMLTVAGLEEMHLTVLAAEAKPPGSIARKRAADEEAIRRAFVGEARELHLEATALVAELARVLDEKIAAPVITQLAVLFHRLKGSALVSSEDEIGEIARSLETACQGVTPPKTAELSLGLARIASKLGLVRAEPVTPSPAHEASTVAATRVAFEIEARQIVDQALARLEGSTNTASASENGVQYELGLLLHRLQGSARIVGDARIADEARALEALLEPDTSSRAPFPAISDRLFELRSQLGPTSSIIAASEASVVGSPRREAVELTAPDELWETFTLECSELLDNIERTTLALEDSTSPKDQLRMLMRMVHTLKGVVNTTGIAPTGRTLHRIEDFLELLLKAPILPPMRAIASLLLGVQVQVRRNLKEARSGWVETFPELLDRKLQAAMSAHQKLSKAVPGRGSAASSQASELYESTNNLPASEISEARGADRRVIRVSTERLDALMNLAGELVVNRSRLDSRVERLQSLQPELVRGSRRLLEAVDTFREEHDFANLDGRQVMAATGTDDARPRAAAPVAAPSWGGFGELELDRYESIHILTRRLAELTSDFAELHNQFARGLSALTDDSDLVGGIVTGIQNEVTRARMVPLEMLFLRLRLPLRDAARREQKEVRDVVRGEQVPVDKTIADALFQPMLHLVRNAVVHGIESPDERVRARKDRLGTIELSARQESGQIVIEVKDDGAGLNLQALLTRGVAMGLLPPETTADDPRVKEMVFAPGLTTRESAGDVAGRGVGGDVVKRIVDRLNGSIRIESKPGVGTIFAIRLPLTLAITHALIVRQGKQSFAVPLHFAERIIDVHEQETVQSGNLRRVKTNGLLVPIRNLGEFLGPDAKGSAEGPVLMLRVGDSTMALQVDAIVAHEEIVVKSLGAILNGHPIFGGINIRGTGELVLIVDVPSLLEGRGTNVRDDRAADHQFGLVPQLASATEAAPADRERARPTSPSRAVRVMFVDDSLSVRKVAEMQLKELGANVTVAVDGVDALAKLHEEEFDIVFTDLEMPRMHGYELIRELRFLPAFKDLPIVVVSSRSGQKHQDQARQLGASEYLTKPFNVQVLAASLKKWVSRIVITEEPRR